VDENRVLVRHGLNCLRHWTVPGIKALETVTGLDKKPALSCEDVAFTIGPRLNAAGRLGQAQLAIELLTTESPERAHQLAEFVHQLNDQRQSLERSILKAANKQLGDVLPGHQHAAIVLADSEWHPGVIGVVAGKLAEKHHCPTILIALDPLGAKPGVGSGRSVPGFNLHAALAACGEHLVSHGGHEAAAGLTIFERNVSAFRAAFCAYAQEAIAEADRVAELFVDAEAPFASLTHQTVKQIESLAPFGNGNRRPTLCTTGVRLAEEPRRMGASGQHVSLRFEQHGVTIRAVAFGGGEWIDQLVAVDGPLAVAFQPVINHFRGRQTVEMHLADWRPEV
jgi:single-stranded-DNA-specific exonuclease